MAGETIKSLGLDKNLTRVLTILCVGAGLTVGVYAWQRAERQNEAEEIKAWATANFQSKAEALTAERRFTDFLLTAARNTKP